MCGVVGIVSKQAAGPALYDALTVMQHRGQDAAGIVTWGAEGLAERKSNGLVRDVFEQRHMQRLLGNVGIGHVRYPTAGGARSAEAQPFYVNSPYGICLAHNGNLTNHDELTEHLTRNDRRHLATTSDSEVLLNVFAHELQVRADGRLSPDQVFGAVEAVHRRCRGGYAVVAMVVGFGIVAFRDPNGIRPLVLGRRESDSGTEYMVASESVALDILQFERVRDVQPGETLYIENGGKLHSTTRGREHRHTPCIFEYVYFARPDSILDDISVYKARLRMGEELAGKIVREFPDHDIDVVIPIPDTSRTAALQVAYHLGVKYREGFIKNRYIGRTFIMPGQARAREFRASQTECDRPRVPAQERAPGGRFYRPGDDVSADHQTCARSRCQQGLFRIRGAARAFSERVWNRHARRVGTDRKRPECRGSAGPDRRRPADLPGPTRTDPLRPP